MANDVGIVGAGVVGLVLARELADMGLCVNVYEGRASVGQGADKASGILSKSGLDRLDLDYSSAVVNRLNGATFHAGETSLTVRAEETKAYILDRVRLAELCADAAERSGARLLLGKRLAEPDIRGLAKENRVLVGADGAVSLVARTFGFPPISEHVLTYKAVYEDARLDSSDSVGIYLDNSITPGFFGWTAPYSDSTVEIAVGVSDRYRMNSAESFRRFARTWEIAGMIKGARLVRADASMIPLHQRRRTAMGNVLLVGDAAGQVKATTGGGIIFGTAIAKMAARSIAAYVERGKALEGHDRNWRMKYGLDLTLHGIAHDWYAGVGNRGVGTLFRLISATGADKLLGRYGDMDSPTATLRRMVFRTA